MRNYDVVIIGAGVCGSSIARELSRFELSAVVIEKGGDVASGTSRANSAIVHGGFDPAPGTLKAHYNVAGSQMFPALARELAVPYRRNGSLVVAFSQDEIPALEDLLERGHRNGVEGLEIIDRKVLHEKEPNLSAEGVAALWVPTGAICDPYYLTLACAENAVCNGAEFRLDTEVTSITPSPGGSEGTRLTVGVEDLLTGEREEVCTRVVINAAGVHAGHMTELAGATYIPIQPRVGEYCLFDSNLGSTFSSTVFQTPTPAGKGVLVTPTIEGNLLVGPDAVLRDDVEDTSTTADGLAFILEKAARTWPTLSKRGIITTFAGTRASRPGHDFIIGWDGKVPGFYNVAGIDSPGLTAAPAIAVDVAAEVADELGADLDPTFDPAREADPSFRSADEAQRAALIAADARYGHIVCRCEQVSEGEIAAAIHAPIPARTIDAVKWRTRAGMGRCQSGFCLPLVAQIIADETGCELSAVRKNDAGSDLLVGPRREIEV